MTEAQARRRWTPPVGTLGELLAGARERVLALTHDELRLRAAAEAAPPAPSLREALRREHVAVIAEVKRSSPSRGSINAAIAAGPQASAYERGGAAAVSVLTEPSRFGGSAEDLAEASRAVAIPTIRKDFHVAAVQLYQARALESERLADLVAICLGIGLEPLVEIRTTDELESALTAGARVIGVNSRDLESLAVDRATVDRLLPQIPRDRVAVAESGMQSRDDIVRAAAAGADAILIGSAVSSAPEPSAAVAALVDVAARRDVRAA